MQLPQCTDYVTVKIDFLYCTFCTKQGGGVLLDSAANGGLG